MDGSYTVKLNRDENGDYKGQVTNKQDDQTVEVVVPAPETEVEEPALG